MSGKVVPIRSAGDQPRPPSGPPKNPRVRRTKKPSLRLRESDDLEGFSTLDVLNGLHGVCQALYHLEPGSELAADQYGELSTAATVLSSMLQWRTEN
jgi:hypothetical protein